MLFPYETYKLKNGLTILLVPYDKTFSITSMALIKSGSALEDEKTQGITHFVEHLAMATNEKYKTKKEFNEILEFNGISYNGSTGQEVLKYYYNAPYKKLDMTLDFLHQTLYHASFSDSDIKQERTIILDEISKYEDDVGYRCNMYTNKLLSMNNSSYILPISGSKESVESFTKEDLLKAYKTVHDPSRVMIAVIGRFDKKETKKLIEDHFGNIESGKPKSYPDEEMKTSVLNAKKDEKTDLIYSTIAFKGPAGKELDTRESWLMGLITTILSGPFSSRLVRRLRDEEGLLYGIYAGNVIFDTFGTILITYETLPEIYAKTLKIVAEELNRFIEKGVTKEELAHYKEYKINRNLVKYDTFHSYSNLYTYPIFYGDTVMTLEEINKEIKEFSLEEVNQYIKKYYKMDEADVMAYGKVDDGTQRVIETAVKNLP